MLHTDRSQPARAAPLIEASSLRKSYGDTEVVAGVDFRVEKGQCWGLLGPNGAGKTTLLRMILGKTQPSSGSLTVFGQSVAENARASRARIGVVPQSDALDPDFTVEENLYTFASYFGLSRHVARGRARDLLRFANLENRARDRVTELSGGMQRRLSLSRALINNPDVLILDEPTTGLDPQARQLIWHRLRELTRAGMTLLLTTHYIEEAERLCDRVTIMDSGTFLDAGSPRALIEKHIEPQVLEIYGDAPDASTMAELESHSRRIERVGEATLCYGTDFAPWLSSRSPGSIDSRLMQRRANLEDVFLKLTGRELRDG